MAKTNDIRLIIRAEVQKTIEDLNRTEKELDDLKKKGGELNNAFSVAAKGVAAFVSVFAIREVAQFADEVANLHAQSEDLKRAMNRLAREEGTSMEQVMTELKEATAGTVSELELMKKATYGKFMGIDLKALPTLLEFARKRAKETGQDINYMVDSIVTGIGRKSPLILDNLGLKMSDLREEIKKVAIENGTWTGKLDQATQDLYLQEAALRVARRAIKDYGEDIETYADTQARLNAEWENAKVRLGKLASVPLGTFKQAVIGVVNALGSLVDELTSDRSQEALDYLEKYSDNFKLIAQLKALNTIDLLKEKIKGLTEEINQNAFKTARYQAFLGDFFEDTQKKTQENFKKIQEAIKNNDTKFIENEIKRLKKEIEAQKAEADLDEDSKRRLEERIINLGKALDAYEKLKVKLKELKELNKQLSKAEEQAKGIGIEKKGKDRITQKDKENETLIQKEQELQEALRKLRLEYAVLTANDETQAKLIELDAWYQEELAKFKDNEEYKIELTKVYEERKKQIILDAEEKKQKELEEQQKTAQKRQEEILAEWQQTYDEYVSQIQGILSGPMHSMVSDMLNGTKRMETIFRNFINNLISQIAHFFTRQLVLKFAQFLAATVISGGNPAAGAAVTSSTYAMNFDAPGFAKINASPEPKGNNTATIRPAELVLKVETVAPELAKVKEYYIKVNREVNIPDTEYVKTFLKTKKGEFD